MANKSSKKPGKSGRPNREFDPITLERLCHVHCPIDEIEFILHTDQRVLNSWCQRHYGEDFNTVYKRYQASGKSSIRINQFALSKTSAAMAIWLGKILLGQRDPTEESSTKKIVGALEQIERLIVVNNDNTDFIQQAS